MLLSRVMASLPVRTGSRQGYGNERLSIDGPASMVCGGCVQDRSQYSDVREGINHYKLFAIDMIWLAV